MQAVVWHAKREIRVDTVPDPGIEDPNDTTIRATSSAIGGSDLHLSDVLPTAWQAVEYAAVPPGGTLAVLGLGPIGDMTTRVAQYRGVGRVIGVDLVPERLDRVRRRGVEVLDLTQHDDIAETIRDM